MHIHIVSAAERVGVVLLEFAAPENAEVVGGKKKSRQQLGSGIRKRTRNRVLQKNMQIEPVSREVTFLERFLTYQLKQFSGNPRGKVPVVENV